MAMTTTKTYDHTLVFDSTVGEGDQPRHHVILMTTCTGRPAMIVDPRMDPNARRDGAWYGYCPDCGRKN